MTNSPTSTPALAGESTAPAATRSEAAGPHVLRHDDLELIIDTSDGFPRIVHWGAPVGVATGDPALRLLGQRAVSASGPDCGVDASALREHARATQGTPAIRGHRQRRSWSPLFTVSAVTVAERSLSIDCVADSEELALGLTYRLETGGVLLVDTVVTNLGEEHFDIDELTTWLPLPPRAAESIDFTGRWLRERQPQRRPIQVGTWVRASREGRSGHDASIVQLATSRGASFECGEVWALAPVWSGASRTIVERTPDGTTWLGAGPVLHPGEISLLPGGSYRAPQLAATYSEAGIDGVSDRFHPWLRSREQHPTRRGSRPLTFNVWEAVYFDHSIEKLSELVDVAAEIGVERFVLDDGWFRPRPDDTSGLGDWMVSPQAWPDGLRPLVERVRAAGMQFGLWFEGEMVNPDSELFRAHPDWVLQVPGRIPPEARHQQVLDLSRADAFAHVLERVAAVIDEYAIDYVKWDHNRYLVDAGGADGIAAAQLQTEAVYRLFDELKRRRPGLEIESCSSGGGRIDLGMVSHVDRFWTSDSNDPFERQRIQRYTGVAIPPELLGTHIGPTTTHSSGRVFRLPIRAITALFGHAGLEWDITETSTSERAHLKEWAQFYRDRRGLLHSGRVVRVDHCDDSALVHGVVAQDRTEALFAYVQLDSAGASIPPSFRLPGLDPQRRYRVRLLEPFGAARRLERRSPAWEPQLMTTGAALDRIGLEPPILMPGEAFLIEAVAAD